MFWQQFNVERIQISLHMCSGSLYDLVVLIAPFLGRSLRPPLLCTVERRTYAEFLFCKLCFLLLRRGTTPAMLRHSRLWLGLHRVAAAWRQRAASAVVDKVSVIKVDESVFDGHWPSGTKHVTGLIAPASLSGHNPKCHVVPMSFHHGC